MPQTPGRTRRGPTALLLAAALGAGCGPTAAPPPEPAPVATTADECLLRPPGAGSGARTAGVFRAATDSAHAALFDPRRRRTPVALSCTGEPRPALATSWSSDSLGSAWTLVLGDTSAGSPTAAELATGWRERPDAAAALRAAGIRSVVPLDARRLLVTFDAPHRSLPAVFAAPALALEPESAEPWPPQVTIGSGSELRDALDAGAELVVTADPEVLAYAASLAGTTLAALPWSRTYVLLMPPGSAGLAGLVGPDSAAFRDGLARDAVPAAARGARPPYWWEQSRPCGEPQPAAPSRSASVLYSREDPVARALAERIVALAGSGGTAAAGLAPREFFGALASGVHAGYVVSLPRIPLVPCLELARWPAGTSALPLVETRATAVLRAGVPPLYVSWDGALVPAGTP